MAGTDDGSGTLSLTLIFSEGFQIAPDFPAKIELMIRIRDLRIFQTRSLDQQWMDFDVSVSDL
jgi:hypothetical protein